MATITDRYSNEDSFMEFLETIGFSPAQRNRISLEGFTSMKILVDHYQLEGASGLEKHLRDLNKTYAGAAQAIRVHYTPLIVSRFAGCLNYFILSIYALHTIPDLSVIDIDIAAKHGRFWTKFKANKASESSNDDDISTDLPKLKGATTWVAFRDAFSYKLRDMSNARGFSMAYIIDSTVRAVNHGNANLLEAADINLNEESVFETRTIHFGDDFRTDNKVLWGMLEGALLNTDPFNLIAQYGKTKDGLKAWKALKAHYEGEDYIQVVREEAMSKLKNTHYKGETRNFKWENYVSSHIKAHKQLLDVGYNNGHGLDDATKIQFFRSNIVPQADMHVALSVARSYERKTFQDYVTFLTTEVNSIVSRKKQSYQPERRVSAYAKRGNNNSNGKRKGSSQLNLGPMLTETVEGKKIESRRYSKEEFGRLTRQQRNAVIRLNRDRRRKAWNNKDSNDEPGINAIEAISEDMKSIHTAVISAISGTNPTSNNTCNNQNKSENDSVVTFDEVASAKSGRIGDYLANKRSKNIKAFTVVSVHIEANDNTLVPSTYSNISSLSTEERYMGCKLGLDSHADVSCIGKHARVLEYLDGQSFTVKPFNDSYSPIKNVKMVNAALAVDMIDGTTIILHLNQCLDFRSTMEDCILCTNQARINKVIVDDIPLSVHPTGDGTHSIYFPEQDLRFPLLLNGPVSYLPVRYPTDWDMDNCQHVDLTNCEGTWNPDDLKNPIPVHNVKSEFNVSGMMKLSERRSLTPDHLSQLWHISINDAKRTIRSTTQSTLRTNEGIRSKRLKTIPHQQLYTQLSNTYTGKFASDTFFSNVLSLRGNKCVQLFTNRANFSKSYPMPTRSSAPKALDRFLHEVGIPPELLTDNAPELVAGEWSKLCKRYNVKQRATEPYSPWQNPAELEGGIIKRKLRRIMKMTLTPIRLWDYAWEYVSSIRALTAMRHFYLDDVTPAEKVYGYTPNITEYISFSWYEWIWYYSPESQLRMFLGRWLGPATNLGQGMAFYVLTDESKVIVRSTVSTITIDEKNTESIKRQMKEFEIKVENEIGNYSTPTISNVSGHMIGNDIYNNIFETKEYEGEIDFNAYGYGDYDEKGEYLKIPSADEIYRSGEPDPIDNEHLVLGRKVKLPHDGENKIGTIENVSAKNNENYEVSFQDGSYAEYSANVLTQSITESLEQNDNNNFSNIVGIIGHRKDDSVAIDKKNSWIDHKGARKRVITTKGWEIEIEFLDGSVKWFPMLQIKESLPIDLAEYAVSRSINTEPAFAWWVMGVLKRKNKIISMLRVPKKVLKYGIKVPGSVDQAYLYDQENGNDLWHKAIEKELKNVRIAFRLMEKDEHLPVGSKLIPYHIIFDVKSDLTRKARLVAGGHRNQVPAHTTYSSVAGRDSVRLGFLLAGLNNLKILACDIGNAYLNAPNREKVHVKVGKELFGSENEGKYAVVDRALYGLKSASAAWRSHFSDTITKVLGYSLTYADNDVYIKARTRGDGSKYYSYLIIYVDDVLCIDENPEKIIERISSVYRVKDGSIEEPKTYLGMNIRKWGRQSMKGETLPCYALGANTYVKEALRIVRNLCAKNKLKFYPKTKANAVPLTSVSYRPELDDSEFCNEGKVTIFQNLIGMLRWMCELGRIDILFETSILSQYLARPRIGHLAQAISIFEYLTKYENYWMVMDPSDYNIDWVPIKDEPSPEERARIMRQMYPDAVEEEPHNKPSPLGKGININVFVDADHAGNKVTRRSHTGIIIYCNCAPILWFSKRQNTVETSTYSSEIIALKIAIEMAEGLRYKLKMFGVSLNGPARVFCDNMAVVLNSSFPESTLKKKNCSVAYGKIRSSIAARIALVYYESSDTNISDLLTKLLSSLRRAKLIRCIMN